MAESRKCPHCGSDVERDKARCGRCGMGLDKAELSKQLEELLEEATRVSREIDETSRELHARWDECERDVDETIAKIEQTLSELDKIEREASDELDKLILEHAEYLAQEEDSDEE
jgi:predicted amidophosphoribosyltransferase